jgi:CubicO group peptidase (beta-lactamase class C family)
MNPRFALIVSGGVWVGLLALPRVAADPDDGSATPVQARAPGQASAYFPPPDAAGGWRRLTTADEIRRLAGLDVTKLDEAFASAEASTKNGGLLVVRHGWLVYERYFGLGHREATPNLASCGKSFTSIAVGILMAERPDLFPDGLDQKIFTPTYLPPEAFPHSDPAKADIKLGQLLAFTAGIRGNNPCTVHGKPVTIDPAGPDGWPALVDAVAVGKRDLPSGGKPTSTATLWCKPGGGYSYATASAHLASMLVRHVSGMELKDYVHKRLAEPMGWGRFTYGYRNASDVTHTPGGGGIAVRATDMLRFGYLLLREGRWGDRQLVPAAYVRHCGRTSPYNPHFPYSLQFNVNTDGQVPEYPRDAFWKSGSGGHMLYVVPSLDLVVWKLAGRDGQYQERDTGVPLAPEIARGAASRRDWKPTLAEREGQRQVLQKVIAAVVDTSATQRPAPAASPNAKHLPGQVLIDPKNPAWLVYNRDADRDGRLDPCFLCGPGGPEGFLFGDISGGDNSDTVLDQIIEHGGNCLYLMAVRSHGGDGKPTHNPFVDHDPAKGLDARVLDRWEKWFQRMEKHGIVIYFFFYDDAVKLGKRDDVSPAERDFVRGLVNRFKHHPNLIWCIAEEYSEGLSREKVKKLAAEIRADDEHDHIIAVHQLRGRRFDFPDDKDLRQFAMQIGSTSAAGAHADCLEARALAGGRYNVLMSELHPYHSDLLVKGDRDGVRRVNWAAAMAGFSVMHLGTWETSQERTAPPREMLQDYRRLHRFLESLSDLNDLAPTDGIVRSGQAWVLGRRGHYLVYLPEGGRVALDLSGTDGSLEVSWYNPRDGAVRKDKATTAGGERAFQAPDERDWVLHLGASRTAARP